MKMKFLRYLPIVLTLSLSTVALAQSHEHQASESQKMEAPKSPAQVSFDTIKSLAGEWQGPTTTDMPEEMRKRLGAGADIRPLHVSLHVTSRGNVLVHEFQEAGTPLDPAKYDHPVTMFYLDSDRLNLVHYCDAGNRPHMTAKASQNGKKLEFEFADLSGSNSHGHMHQAVFTIIDGDHHTEDWTYMLPNDTPIHAHFDLHRVESDKLSSKVW
jgi:hypothetical protein